MAIGDHCSDCGRATTWPATLCRDCGRPKASGPVRETRASEAHVAFLCVSLDEAGVAVDRFRDLWMDLGTPVEAVRVACGFRNDDDVAELASWLGLPKRLTKRAPEDVRSHARHDAQGRRLFGYRGDRAVVVAII